MCGFSARKRDAHPTLARIRWRTRSAGTFHNCQKILVDTITWQAILID
jgi:hypothetical protein